MYAEARSSALSDNGSGSVFARGALKKLWNPRLDEASAVRVAVEALYDAADDDSATGGPDLTRRIFPVVHVVTADGGRRLTDEAVAEIADRVVSGRMLRPDGPVAPLTTPGGGGEEQVEHAQPRLDQHGSKATERG